MGVGYVIGPRIAGTMFAGGVLSWLVLLPLMSIMGAAIPTPFPPITPANALNPATGQPFLISEMSPGQIWSAYIRYIGAGAVLAAGLITLGRTLPTIISSAREGLKGFGGGRRRRQLRTERDIPMTVVLFGSLALAIFLMVMPGLPTQGNIVASVLIIIFGFFFATVSSRITGLIGSSSNPISGMTIATLIITCVIFVALGWNDSIYAPVALSVGRDHLHCRRQRRQHLAGSQDRLHRRRDADLSADGAGDWRHHLVVRDRLDAASICTRRSASARRRWRRRRRR